MVHAYMHDRAGALRTWSEIIEANVTALVERLENRRPPATEVSDQLSRGNFAIHPGLVLG